MKRQGDEETDCVFFSFFRILKKMRKNIWMEKHDWLLLP
jgi:hypothetical protein